jgi:hypothetical protein
MIYTFAQALGVAPESLLPEVDGSEPAVRPELVADFGSQDRKLFEMVVGRARADVMEERREKP